MGQAISLMKLVRVLTFGGVIEKFFDGAEIPPDSDVETVTRLINDLWMRSNGTTK
jgi:hypothetical protein